MAITGALFNTLTFGGINSGDYGVYITGEGVFNAPVRAVEMFSVPGRNGDLALDSGHYENITVTYPAGIYGNDGVDFRERLSDFRNAILSQKGYQRLEDSYHPDEFRLGVYIDGLEVVPVHYNEAGKINLVFNCKPQRFLVNGEQEITLGNPKITNPTLMESAPNFVFTYETFLGINFDSMAIFNVSGPVGEIEIYRLMSDNRSDVFSFDLNLFKANDKGYYYDFEYNVRYGFFEVEGNSKFELGTLPSEIDELDIDITTSDGKYFDVNIKGRIKVGVSNQDVRSSIPLNWTHGEQSGTTNIEVENFSNSTSRRVQVSFTARSDSDVFNYNLWHSKQGKCSITSTKGIGGIEKIFDSETETLSLISSPENVDISDRILSINKPLRLKAGENDITRSSVSTKIIPRWWKL